MMEQYNTKDINPSEGLDKVTIKAVSQIKNEYHFPGGGKWKPISVVASTIDEATEIWKLKRTPVNPEEKVVDEKSETNNE